MSLEAARNVIVCADCLTGMQDLPSGIADCCVTDPPYGIRFMGKKWDYTIPGVEVWGEVLRILKPGAHMLVACGTRTQHRMAVNIEDAGFEIRDVICWHYGQGFPKSQDVSKAIDKQAGVERKIIGARLGKGGENLNRVSRPKGNDSDSALGCGAYGKGAKQVNIEIPVTAPSTEAAKKWDGYGTALKPATEFWTLARKPLQEKTIAENVIALGTGALNIDACRITWPGNTPPEIGTLGWGGPYKKLTVVPGSEARTVPRTDPDVGGRFPANLIMDEFMAAEMDKQTGELESGEPAGVRKATNNVYGSYAPGQPVTGYGDAGGGSRFFYVAKASAEERGAGNTHPTVKPLTLLHYLIRLICPIEPGRLLLDPFAGSGTHCIAARQLGLDFVAYEKDPDSVRIAGDRMREKLGFFI